MIFKPSSRCSSSKKLPQKANPGRRHLTVFFLCILAILPVSLYGLVAAAGADPADEIAVKMDQAEAVRSELSSLNQEMEAKIESYNYANMQLANIETDIVKNEAKLQETTVTLNQTQIRLDERMVNIYKNGSVDVIDVLMDTSDLTDFLTMYDMLAKVGEQDMNDVEQVQLLKEQVEATKLQLAEDQTSQETMVVQLENEKAEIEGGIAERNSMLAGMEDEIAALEAEQAAAEAAAEAALFAAQVEANNESYDEGADGDVDYGPAPPATAGGAVDIAMQYLGVPYAWGGSSPSGFDCSGLVMYVYNQMGIGLPHSAAAQFSATTPVSYDEMAPGDLVFFGYGGISHVGIYIGGGSMIHAPFEGEVVSVAPVSSGGSFRGAGRV